MTKSTKLKWVQGEIQTMIDESPEKFLNVVKDSNFDIMSLIHRAVDAKIIIKEGNQYVTADGLELAQPGEIATFDTAVRFLADDKNQEVRALIEARIDNAK